MTLEKLLKKCGTYAVILGFIGINYQYGYKPTGSNLTNGMTREQNETYFSKKYYTGKKGETQPVTCLMDPLTMVGRTAAYAMHLFFENTKIKRK